MSILDTFGQDRAIARLQLARRACRISHSYVFHGPEGVGKSLLASQWAKLMLCAEPVKRPWSPATPMSDPDVTLDQIDDCCDHCHDCHLVDIDNHPDLHIIRKDLIQYAKQGRERKMIALPIDVIREFVIAPAGALPSRGRARVFIIDQAEDMNRAAQNALLKTLEEPPDRTFLLLITSKPDLLLPTVRSRCQTIRFARLPADFVVQRLKGANVNDVEAKYWAHFSAGRLGIALSLAQSNLYEKKCYLIEQLAQISYASALRLAAWLVDQAQEYGQNCLKALPGYSQSSATRQGQSYYFAMMAHAFGLALREGATDDATGYDSFDQPQQIARIARRFGPDGSAEAIAATNRAEKLLQANVNHTLILESLMLEYLDCIGSCHCEPTEGRRGNL